MNKVVVFGAGLVVRAHVRYLLDHGFEVTVASRTVSKAEDIIDGHPKGTPMAFDITVEPLVQLWDFVVISGWDLFSH